MVTARFTVVSNDRLDTKSVGVRAYDWGDPDGPDTADANNLKEPFRTPVTFNNRGANTIQFSAEDGKGNISPIAARLSWRSNREGHGQTRSSATAMVTITVLSANDAPAANNDGASTREQAPSPYSATIRTSTATRSASRPSRSQHSAAAAF